jgi:hypothetical protein
VNYNRCYLPNRGTGCRSSESLNFIHLLHLRKQHCLFIILNLISPAILAGEIIIVLVGIAIIVVLVPIVAIIVALARTVARIVLVPITVIVVLARTVVIIVLVPIAIVVVLARTVVIVVLARIVIIVGLSRCRPGMGTKTGKKIRIN